MKKFIHILFILCASLLWAATPSVKFIYLYNDDDGQTTNPTTSLTGNDYMTLWFQVKDGNGYTNIASIDVVVWNSNHSSLTDSNSDEYHAQYKYYPQFEDWSLVGPFSWAINEAYCNAPAKTVISSNFQNFTLVFQPGNQAIEAYNKDWKITIVVKDNDGNSTNVSASFSLMQVESSQSAGSGGVFYVAPNPLKIKADDMTLHLYYEPGFSENCNIDLKIYTIYGELVKTIVQNKSFTVNQTLSETWDCKNGANINVVSGIYTAVLSINYDSGQKEKQYFKFAIYK